MDKVKDLNSDTNLLEQEKKKFARDRDLYGHQGNFIKRHGNLDDLTVGNSNYKTSLSHQKYNYKGANGWYSEKEMQPWHAQVA